MEELLNRIKNKLSEEETKLVCQVDINDEDYKQLLEISKTKINRLLYSYTQPTIVQADEILVVTLVQIAIRKYNNGDYWGTLDKEMGTVIPQQKKNYIGEIFNKTLRKYNLFEITSKDRNIYVENIKAHTFVPNNYMEGYLDFLFSFYNKNLLRQLTETLSEDLQDLINFLTRNMQSDDVIDESSVDNPKTYRLLKSTKRVISQCGEDFIKKILSIHISLIDSYYYGDNVEFISEERFSKSIQKWTETRIDTDSKNRKRKNLNSSYFGKPYFKIIRQQPYLVIPPQKIRESLDKDNIGKVSVSYDGDSREYKLEYYRAYGIIISEEKIIPIENLFEQYKVRIVGTSKTHTISSNEYRIFDINYNEVNQMKKGDYYLLVKKGKNIVGNRYVYKNTEYRSWDEYRFNNINSQTILYLDAKPITNNKGFEQPITFDNHFKQCKVYKDEKLIDVTQMHPTISFEINKFAIDGTFILCNSKKYNLVKDCLFETEDGGENKVKVVAHLHEFLPIDDDFYQIRVDEPGCRIKTICDYLFLNYFECDIKDRVYIFEKKVTFHIKSDNEIKPLNFDKVDNGIYEIKLAEDNSCAEFMMSLKGKEYKFSVDIPVFKYGFEKQWKIEFPEVLLCKNLKNDLWIMMPNATEGLLQLNDDYYRISGDKCSCGFRFDIMSMINSIRKSSYVHNYIKFWYYDNEWKVLPLFTILNKIHISKFNLLREKRDVLFDIQVEGCAQLVIEVKELCGGKTVDTFDLVNGPQKLPKLSPVVGYKINIFEKDELGFGFGELVESRDFPVELLNFKDKALQINYILMKDNGTKLPLNENYKIQSISSYFRCYQGEMKADCALLVKKVKFSYTKEKDVALIYDLQGLYQGNWLNLFYNRKTKTIIKQNNCKFDRNKQLHKDFTELNEAFMFVVTIKE